MSQGLPFVSIVVPVRNGERTIGRLLQSLAALDYPADRREVWIVDNLSTDRTREMVQDSGFQFIEESRVQSSYAARNRGIQAARGGAVGVCGCRL